MNINFILFFIMIIFSFVCRGVAAAEAPASASAVDNARDDVYQNPLFELSNIWLKLDFENSVVESVAGKEKSDSLRVQDQAGQVAGRVGIYYEAGTKSDRFAQVIVDPTNKGNKVLHYWLKNARIGNEGYYKGRIQLVLKPVNKFSLFQRVRLYLHPDLAIYREYPEKNTWFNLATMWMGARWEDHPYPLKLSLNIAKPRGVGMPLYFVASAAIADGDTKWKGIWAETGANYEVPVGEWLDIEIAYAAGDDTSGRYYMGVKRSSEERFTTVLDVTNWTYNPNSPEPVPLTHWNPLKLYTSSDIIDFVRKSGGVSQLYWDDLEAYDVNFRIPGEEVAIKVPSKPPGQITLVPAE